MKHMHKHKSSKRQYIFVTHFARIMDRKKEVLGLVQTFKMTYHAIMKVPEKRNDFNAGAFAIVLSTRNKAHLGKSSQRVPQRGTLGKMILF